MLFFWRRTLEVGFCGDGDGLDDDWNGLEFIVGVVDEGTSSNLAKNDSRKSAADCVSLAIVERSKGMNVSGFSFVTLTLVIGQKRNCFRNCKKIFG